MGLNLNELTDKAKDLTAGVSSTVTDKNTRNEMFKKICALIPNKIDNSAVINAFELMRKQQQLIKKDFSAKIASNEAAFKKHEAALKKNGGYVEDQNAWTDVSYGESTMQYSGCEIFATFNAIRNIMGKESSSLILTMYNDGDDISKEVHTINISKAAGKFTAHNVYCNGKVVGPYATVSEVIKNINGGKAKGISLIGITKA